MAWRRQRVAREQIMNGRKAQDQADLATPRQPAMEETAHLPVDKDAQWGKIAKISMWGARLSLSLR
jgi:hypothetical protein